MAEDGGDSATPSLACDEAGSPGPAPRATATGGVPVELSVVEVTVRFGGLSVLEDVSLVASTGEIVGVIGPNGAGKTTLFNVICGFVRPAAGTIVWKQKDLHRQHPQDLAGLGIARTLQGVGLFHGLSALENVMIGEQPNAKAGLLSSMLGLPRSSREERRLQERAMAALKRLGVAQYSSRMPSTLPYPVQKRIAVARALVGAPDLVLMDEPASGLSAEDIEELAELLSSLRGEMGVLIVEHNMDLVMATCDRIVVLDFGRVIATGSPAEIRTDPAVTTAYLGAPVGAGALPKGGRLGTPAAPASAAPASAAPASAAPASAAPASAADPATGGAATHPDGLGARS